MAEEIIARGSILGKCLPARYVIAILGSIGMAIIYGLKVNLSVSMVAMLNHTALSSHKDVGGHGGHGDPLNLNITSYVNALNVTLAKTIPHVDSEECHPPASAADSSGPAKVEDGPFVWSDPLQGIALSCYFWGYLVSQIPGAQIAEKYSAKWVMLFSVAINVICTLLTPLMTKAHFVGLVIMRVLEGIGGGATFPAMHCMIAAWAPPNERFVVSTIIYVGTSAGTAVSILMAGVIADALGWESVFYIMGGLSIIWMVLWTFLAADNPNKQRFISQEERDFINNSLGTTSTVKEEHPPVPWKSVLTSVPFWAILISHCCSNWGWYMFLIEIPFYMKQVLKFNVASNAVASALPYLPMLIISIILGKVLDWLKSRQTITTTFARKLATAIATIIPGVCLLILCYIGCRHTMAVVIMCIGIVGMGGMFSGFLSNHIDIAPNFAGTLVAITNTAATLPGIIVPIFVGLVTKENKNIHAWRLIFFVTIVLFAIEFIVFSIFGSGEEQAWNKKVSKKDNKEQNESTPLQIK